MQRIKYILGCIFISTQAICADIRGITYDPAHTPGYHNLSKTQKIEVLKNDFAKIKDNMHFTAVRTHISNTYDLNLADIACPMGFSLI